MTRSFRIARIFGISIEVDYTWFIIFFLVALALSTGLLRDRLPGLSMGARWLVAAVATLLFFGSVLVHELSHSVVALRNGLEITGITLFLFGGVSRMANEPRSAKLELKMALAGPLSSLVLAALFLGLAYLMRSLSFGQVYRTVFWWLGWVNGMLAMFNLLPGFPLDGGRILRAGIWQASSNLQEATRIAALFGQGLGAVMIVGGIMLFVGGAGLGGLWLALIGWFLIQAAQSSYQQLLLRQALSGVPVSRVMTSEVLWVPADTPLDRVVDEYVMAYNHPAFPVLDDGRPIGLLCLGDIRQVPRERWSQTAAGEVAPALDEGNTISPGADSWEALVRMASGNCGRLVVIEDGQLRGIVSRTDIMRMMRTRIELGA